MGWLEFEELRNIRENQERAEFESWQRRNPDEADRLYEENQEWLRTQLNKQKEDKENREKIAQEVDEKLTAIIVALLNPLISIVLPLVFIFGLLFLVIQVLSIAPEIVIFAIGTLAFLFFIVFLLHLLKPSGRRRRSSVPRKAHKKFLMK